MIQIVSTIKLTSITISSKYCISEVRCHNLTSYSFNSFMISRSLSEQINSLKKIRQWDKHKKNNMQAKCTWATAGKNWKRIETIYFKYFKR